MNIQDNERSIAGSPEPTPIVLPRKLSDHKTNVANELIDIIVMDEKGSGGAHHHYVAYWPSGRGIQSAVIKFQNGPIKESGVNGVTQEVLLAVVIDRLRCFQAGPYKCESNEQALICAEGALEALKSRTLERQDRGVEGTHTV